MLELHFATINARNGGFYITIFNNSTVCPIAVEVGTFIGEC